jgi:hypothetical protein
MVVSARSESMEPASSTASSTSTPPSHKKVGTTISTLMPTPATTATVNATSTTAAAVSMDGTEGESNATMALKEPARDNMSSTPEVLNTQEEDKLLFHDNKYEDSLAASNLLAALKDTMVQISVSEMNIDLEPESELMEIPLEATRKLDTH